MWSSLQLFVKNLSSNHPYFFTSFAFFLFTLFIFKWFTSLNGKKNYLPPSPPTLPVIGNLHQLGRDPHRSLHSLAQRYGPLMLLHLGQTTVLIVSSAKAAREIMKTHDLIFSNRPKSYTSEMLLYNYKDVAAAPYGEYWRQMRSISVLHLLSSKRVQSFRAVREEETALMIKKIEFETCNFSSKSKPIDLSEMFVSLTNDVVCRVALGRKYGGEGRFKEMLSEFVELVGGVYVRDFIPWLGWIDYVNGFDAKFDKVSKEFDSFLDKVVDEHVGHLIKESSGSGHGEDGKHKDFVDVLLEAQRESAIGFPIDRVTIKALILDMFAAGTDTTYTVLEWAMTELLRHPKSMTQLQEEVRCIAGSKSFISEDDLDQMHYLKAVIKESLRLHPPLPLLFPRESTQDVNIMGYEIPRGTRVMTNVWAMGRDPTSWDEPDEFKPERFLINNVDFKGHNFELIPFGAGRRGCPGIQFAIAINELVLANVVHKFNWELPGGAEGEDLDMSETAGLTIHRKFPLLVSSTLHTE